MRKSLLVLLVILFVAPILASCAPYWYGYGPYGYEGYYEPGVLRIRGVLRSILRIPRIQGILRSISRIQGVLRSISSISRIPRIQGIPLKRSAP